MASSLCCVKHVDHSKNNENDSDSDLGKEISYHVILESSTSDLDQTDTESVASFQANTTTRDSSDISIDSDYEMNEYEIVYSSENEQPKVSEEDAMSSSSIEDIRFNSNSTSDPQTALSDISNNSDAVEVLPPKELFPICAQCCSVNSQPLVRFCDNCYKARKESFPPKPRPKNKRKLIPSDQCPVKKPKSIKTDFTDSNCASGSSLLTTSTEHSSSVHDSGYENFPSDDCSSEFGNKCLTCLSRPINGVFLHSRTAHMCCCYRCARKIWHQSKTCPICRRRVHNVILLLNS